MALSAHLNTDRTNASCYCRIGADHGNATTAEIMDVLRFLLRHHGVNLGADRGDVIVAPIDPTHTARIYSKLQGYGLAAQMQCGTDPGGRGIRVPAETFNR